MWHLHRKKLLINIIDAKSKYNNVTPVEKETADDKDDTNDENKTENHDVTNVNDEDHNKKLCNNNEESEYDCDRSSERDL